MKSSLKLFVALALTLASSSALAGPEEDVAAQSRGLFETGAKEYEKGNYQNAIRAFEQAHTLTKRPGLLYSIAQAYRKQFGNDGQAQNLRKSLEFFQRYLIEDTEGKRRTDASRAVKELEAMLKNMPAPEPTATVQEPPAPTQISITASSVAEDVMISVDGAPPRPLEPVEVTPGDHRVVITAPGYFKEERVVRARKSEMTGFDLQLRPMPARVSITGRTGAEVRVDGQPLGTLPLVAPLEVEAGDKTISVSMNGFVTYNQERSLNRGEELSLDAKLSRTGQRTASFVLAGAGIITAGLGVFVAASASVVQEEALGLEVKRTTRSITKDEFDRYKNLVNFRDGAQIGGTVLLNAGIAIGALSFLLYYFDEPKLTVPQKKKDEKKKEKPKEPGMRDIAFLPAASAGYLGGSLVGQF